MHSSHIKTTIFGKYIAQYIRNLNPNPKPFLLYSSLVFLSKELSKMFAWWPFFLGLRVGVMACIGWWVGLVEIGFKLWEPC